MRLNIWKMKPMWSARNASRRAPRKAETATSPTVTVPCCGTMTPATRLRSVLLPLPEGPLRKTFSPWQTANVSISSTKGAPGFPAEAYPLELHQSGSRKRLRHRY